MSPRLRRVLLVAIGGTGYVLTLGIVTALADWGSAEFICSLVLLLVISLALDTRRRSSILLRRVDDTKASINRHASEIGRLREALAAATDHASREVRTALDDARVGITQEIASSSTAVAATIGGSIDRIGEAIPLHGIQTIVARESNRLYQQTEAILRLAAGVGATGMTPPMRGWAASPDVIALLVTELRTLKPAYVVECGSGASTVWLAMAIRAAALPTRLVALEHDAAFGAATRRALDDCQVADVAEVRVAPLIPVTIDSHTYRWYDPACLEGVHEVGLVFVDGPPADTGPGARFPALPMIHALLSIDATVVLDDTIRPDEKAISSDWSARFPEFHGVEANLEKGAWIMRRRADGGHVSQQHSVCSNPGDAQSTPGDATPSQ